MTVVEVGMGVFILTHSSKPPEELHSFNQEPVWPANIQITLHVPSVCLDITSKNFQFDMPEELDTYCAPRHLHSSSDIRKDRLVYIKRACGTLGQKYLHSSRITVYKWQDGYLCLFSLDFI